VKHLTRCYIGFPYNLPINKPILGHKNKKWDNLLSNLVDQFFFLFFFVSIKDMSIIVPFLSRDFYELHNLYASVMAANDALLLLDAIETTIITIKES
jgi:hypothetical protein